MKIAFLGDIVGRSGREAVARFIPRIRSELAPDIVIANGENASHGFGLSPGDAQHLLNGGVDVITLGNHAFDCPKLAAGLEEFPAVVRPLNWPSKAPGRGFAEIRLKTGQKILVVNLLGQLFMQPTDSPFSALEKLLAKYRLGQNVNAIFVDFHGEAGSEKMAAAHLFDGKVTAVVGTHTHVPTADARILPKGAAYQSDAGMCGDYDSIIGMKVETSLPRLLRRPGISRLAPAEKAGSVSGILVEADDKTGLARRIAPFHYGAPFRQSFPFPGP